MIQCLCMNTDDRLTGEYAVWVRVHSLWWILISMINSVQHLWRSFIRDSCGQKSPKSGGGEKVLEQDQREYKHVYHQHKEVRNEPFKYLLCWRGGTSCSCTPLPAGTAPTPTRWLVAARPRRCSWTSWCEVSEGRSSGLWPDLWCCGPPRSTPSPLQGQQSKHTKKHELETSAPRVQGSDC